MVILVTLLLLLSSLKDIKPSARTRYANSELNEDFLFEACSNEISHVEVQSSVGMWNRLCRLEKQIKR
jgi:hypothetical protein